MHDLNRPNTPTLPGIALLCLLLGGCASEKAVLNQTQPLQERMDRVEQTLTSANNTTLRAAEARNEVLSRHQTDLDKQLTDVRTGVAQLRDQFNGREIRLTNALAQLEEKNKSLHARLTDTQQQLKDVLTLARSNAQQNTRLQAEQTQADADGAKRAADMATNLATQMANKIADANTRIEAVNRLFQSTAAEISKLDLASRKHQTDAELADDSLNKRVQAAEEKLNTLSGLVQEALALAAKEIFLANGKEAFTVMLTYDNVLYPQNDPILDTRDIAKLNELATNLGKLDQEYHLDIQGHTSNNSTEDNNYNLGKARAEVAKRYLYEKQGISINRMSTISYGASKPLNNGKDNNRRIYIRVLVLK